MSRRHAYILVAALLATLASTAGAQRTRERSDRAYAARLDTTFAFGARGSAEIRARAGDVVVRAWGQPQVRIRAAAERGTIRVDGSSSYFTLALEGDVRRSDDARIEVMVPVGTRVRVASQAGDIIVAGTKAEVDAHTMSGDLQLEDVADRVQAGLISGDVALRRVSGDVRVTTVSGDVGITDASGDVEATSVSGDVTLRGVTSRNVRARTTGGDVSYEGTIDPAGRYELGSHSGDVSVVMPQDASAQITVSTFSGTIDSDFPITLGPGTVQIGGTKRFTFTVGRGDARVSAGSFSGDVTIRQRGRARDR